MLPTLLFWLNDIDFDNETTLGFFDRKPGRAWPRSVGRGRG